MDVVLGATVNDLANALDQAGVAAVCVDGGSTGQKSGEKRDEDTGVHDDLENW